MSAPPLVVLYAEDSEDDAFLMRRAFTKAKFPGSLVVATDGAEARRYLAGEGKYADRAQHPRPCLILLDIKMPHLNGLEVLAWIRGQAEWKDVPVLMLTSSSQEKDLTSAYGTGADSYLLKPTSLDTFRELVEDVMAICTAPERAPGRLKVRGSIPPAEPGAPAR